MRPAMHHPRTSAARADALFVSALQRCEDPSTGQVRQAVAEAVHTFGQDGCAERMAQEFGDHPETAIIRMRWARKQIGEAYGRTARPRLTAKRLAARHSRAPRHGRAA